MPKISPNPHKEYVLVYDHPPVAGETILVKKDTVVVNVRFRRRPGFMGDMLLFNVKETGEQHETHYGYMFAENTPENLVKLSLFRDATSVMDAAKVARAKALAAVVTVKGPFEGATR